MGFYFYCKTPKTLVLEEENKIKLLYYICIMVRNLRVMIC